MLTALAQLGIGLAVLTLGGYVLVRGATALALLAHVSTTVIGLTVVAMGTSLPELAVSLDAARLGSTEMAYGNIVGSNIFNIAVVLAVAAFIRAIPVTRQTFRVEYPFMLFATALALLLGRDGLLDRTEGLFAVILLGGFTGYIIRHARRIVPPEEKKEFRAGIRRTSHLKESGTAWLRNLGLVAVGMALLTIGAQQTVVGGVLAAQLIGVSERIIGLTILAVGTSLPELATVVVAARHDEPGLVIGNVIGSNIFNILAILGTTSIVYPVTVAARAQSFDNWVMLGFSILLLPLMWTRRRVGRFDATALIILFGLYNWFLLR